MPINNAGRKNRKKIKTLLLIVWLLLLALYIQSFFEIGKPVLPSSLALRILVRSVIILLTWYFLIGPALKQLLHKWLQRKKQESAVQVKQVLDLLPATQNLVSRSWRLSAGKKGVNRILFFSKIILANTFYNTDA